MKNRRVIRAIFDNIEGVSSEDIAGSEILKNLLSENVPQSIARAHSMNQDHATVFEINTSECYVEIPKSQWVPALESIISWYSDEKVQDYEKCAEIAKLVQAVKVGRKPKNKVTDKTNRGGKTRVRSDKGRSEQDAQRKDGTEAKEQE